MSKHQPNVRKEELGQLFLGKSKYYSGSHKFAERQAQDAPGIVANVFLKVGVRKFVHGTMQHLLLRKTRDLLHDSGSVEVSGVGFVQGHNVPAIVEQQLKQRKVAIQRL